MTLIVPPEEPSTDAWSPLGVDELIARIGRKRVEDRPLIVAIDGRSGAGKSTLAALIQGALTGAAIVHTDDLAWNEPYFEWGHLLRDGVLRPLHAGEGVDFRPPAWLARARLGSVRVPAGSTVVIIEGVGAAQRAVGDLLDFSIWVQSDFAEAERRGIARDIADGVNGEAVQATAFWHEWMAHENRYLVADRPWDRADLFVAGTTAIALPPGQLASAPPPGKGAGRHRPG